MGVTIRLLNADEIDVKVKKVGERGAQVLLYKTARVDMAILDESFGVMNWESDYKVIKDNLYCGIGIRESEDKPFVWKWDCGIESREDDEGNQKKGEASDAFKRAGFKVGIGRELYTAPRLIFLKVATQKDGNKYSLSDRFATFSVSDIKYSDTREITALQIVDKSGEVVYSYGSRSQARSKSDTPKQTDIPFPEVPPVTAKPITVMASADEAQRAVLIEDFKSYGGNINGLASYFKKTVDELAVNDILFGISQKTKAAQK